MKRYSAGFTLVELAIAIVVIGILAMIASVSFNNTQREARDSMRDSTAAAIANGLEKYYENNGEYPSVRSLVNSYSTNTAEAVSNKIGVPKESLRLPNTPNSARTAISTNHNLSNDYIGYSGFRSGSGNSACQNSLDGGCDSFALTYQSEASEEVRTIESRY